jgi:alpha-tubulin suppressor-like RCC1 family protein
VLKEMMSKAGALVVLLLAATAAPAAAQPPGDPISQVAAGGSQTCGIAGTKTYCWGYNVFGQLGNGDTANQDTPVPVRAPHGVVFTQLAGGYFHNCGISGARTYCWGFGGYGQLGNGRTVDHKTAGQVQAPSGVVFTRLAAGNDHTCGISGAGAFCWGAGGYGQLGDGGTANQATPVPVRAPGGVVFTQLAGGYFHTCGIAGTKTYCWGYNALGQLGTGGTASQTTPVRVRAPRGVEFIQIAAGYEHTCGISRARAYCWGSGENGLLGTGGTADHLTPVPVLAPRGVAFTQLVAGRGHTCGLSGTSAYCWGFGGSGQLGNGRTADQYTPVPVRAPRGVAFTQLAAGSDHTCGISGSRTYCWGWNGSGQLGNGGSGEPGSGTPNRWTPVQVLAPSGGALPTALRR